MNSTCKNQERKQIKIRMMHKKITYKTNIQYIPWFVIDKDDHFLSYKYVTNDEAR